MITIKISQESSDSRLARPKTMLSHLFIAKEVRPMTKLLKGGARDGESYHNAQSAGCAGNDQY